MRIWSSFLSGGQVSRRACGAWTALAGWDAWDHARTLPAEQRPAMSEPGPLHGRALESLRQVVVETLGDLEQVWQRRN